MKARTVKANNKVEADRGRVAVERGPLVYCAEWADNDFNVLNVLTNQKPTFEIADGKVLTYSVKQLKTQAQTLGFGSDGRLQTKDVTLTLIPYYAWAHRGTGNMAVWLSQDLSATSPAKQGTLSSKSKISASTLASTIIAINDRLVPSDESDRTIPYYHWWPNVNTTEWIVYDFPSTSTIHNSTVYWFDDAPWGECRVPQSWKIFYKDDNGQ